MKKTIKAIAIGVLLVSSAMAQGTDNSQSYLGGLTRVTITIPFRLALIALGFPLGSVWGS